MVSLANSFRFSKASCDKLSALQERTSECFPACLSLTVRGETTSDVQSVSHLNGFPNRIAGSAATTEKRNYFRYFYS